MTKDRLRNGGFDRLRKSYNEDVTKMSNDAEVFHNSDTRILQSIDPKNEITILREKPISGTESQISNKFSHKAKRFVPFSKKVGGIGETLVGFTGKVKKGLPKFMTSYKNNQVAAHEFVHYLYWPASRPKGVNNTISRYLWGKSRGIGSGEIAARGTELKNYFGLKEGETLTPEMWDYAKRHFFIDI